MGVRRNVVTDVFGSGAYIGWDDELAPDDTISVKDFLWEENYVFRCADHELDDFNENDCNGHSDLEVNQRHGIYLDTEVTTDPMRENVIRNNVHGYAAGQAFNLRSSARIEDNLAFQSSIGISVGGGDGYPAGYDRQEFTVTGNAITRLAKIGIAVGQPAGWGMQISHSQNSDVSCNMIFSTDGATTARPGMDLNCDSSLGPDNRVGFLVDNSRRATSSTQCACNEIPGNVDLEIDSNLVFDWRIATRVEGLFEGEAITAMCGTTPTNCLVPSASCIRYTNNAFLKHNGCIGGDMIEPFGYVEVEKSSVVAQGTSCIIPLSWSRNLAMTSNQFQAPSSNYVEGDLYFIPPDFVPLTPTGMPGQDFFNRLVVPPQSPVGSQNVEVDQQNFVGPTLEDYALMVAGMASLDAFVAACELQRRGDWRPELEANAAISYFDSVFAPIRPSCSSGSGN